MTDESRQGRSGAGAVVARPVCRMGVDPGAARDSLEYQGATHALCNRRCRDRFEARPEHFIARRGEAPLTPVTLG